MAEPTEQGRERGLDERGKYGRCPVHGGDACLVEYESQREKPIIRIVFTDADVRAMAEAVDVPEAEALGRAEGWAKYISETATTLVSEQLASVVETNSP